MLGADAKKMGRFDKGRLALAKGAET